VGAAGSSEITPDGLREFFKIDAVSPFPNPDWAEGFLKGGGAVHVEGDFVWFMFQGSLNPGDPRDVGIASVKIPHTTLGPWVRVTGLNIDETLATPIEVPFLNRGASGEWDDGTVHHLAAIRYNNMWYGYYDGRNGDGNWQIGLVKVPIG
jgi:hypothetical protein